MKEPDHITVSTIDRGKKRKNRKGGTSFSNSKQRRRREFKKKEETWIEGRGTPTNLQNMCGESNRRSLNGHLNLHPFKEEREDNDSHATSMIESEYRNTVVRAGFLRRQKIIRLLQ